jgi:hypothetical protein
MLICGYLCASVFQFFGAVTQPVVVFIRLEVHVPIVRDASGLNACPGRLSPLRAGLVPRCWATPRRQVIERGAQHVLGASWAQRVVNQGQDRGGVLGDCPGAAGFLEKRR